MEQQQQSRISTSITRNRIKSRKSDTISLSPNLFAIKYTTFLLSISIFIYHITIINSVIAKNSSQKPTPPATYLQRPDSSGRPLLMVASYCPNNANNELSSSSSSASSSQSYYNQYLDIDTSKWRTNRDSSSICTQDKRELLELCKKVYPNHDIRNIVESSRSYKIENWCKLNSNPKRRCRSRFRVKPYRCLEGVFQSDALLVPERCLFDHLHNKTICDSSTNWNKIATDNCQFKSMKLESFAMLQPCGLGIFSGVEFVCCPQGTSSQQQQQVTQEQDQQTSISTISTAAKPQTQAQLQQHQPVTSETKNNNEQTNNNGENNKSNVPQSSLNGANSFAQATSETSPAWPETTKEQQSRSNKESELSADKDSDSDSDSDPDDDEETWDSNEDDDEDEHDDDSTNTNESPSSSTSTSTTTTTTTTTTTQRPIDHYLAHFDIAHERDEFRRAELSVENTYHEKIDSVIKNWHQVDSHYEEMKKRDPQAAEQFKISMTSNLQKTIQALEEEGAKQKHQLAAMHAERAMALINRRKKSAMDCLTQALDKVPIRTRQVEKCIVRLLKALEKDRAHTFRQYKNLLILNTHEALREKKIILDHLVTLNRAANQSIAMLHRSPLLVDKLKSKIVKMWHDMRNIPLNEAINRESEAKIMDRLEEEVALRKIEEERQKMSKNVNNPTKIDEETKKGEQLTDSVPANKQTELFADNKQNSNNNNLSNNVNNNNANQAIQNESHNTPVVSLSTPINENHNPKQQEIQVKQSSTAASASKSIPTIDDLPDESDNEINDRIINDGPKYSHLKSDISHHELTFSIKPEPVSITTTTRWGQSHPVLLISSCVIIMALALFGAKYYNKNSTRAYKRQGFAEVGRSCPEEKSVANLQFNGYENPAYKFFESEA